VSSSSKERGPREVVWWSGVRPETATPPRILVIEAAPPPRRLAQALAAASDAHGWQLETVGSADLARALLLTRHYLAIVIDARSTDARGLLEAVRASPRAAGSPVVICGDSAPPEGATEGTRSGTWWTDDLQSDLGRVVERAIARAEEVASRPADEEICGTPLRAILDGAAVGISGVDEDGDIVYANRACAALLRAPDPDALTGLPLARFLPDAAVSRVLDAEGESGSLWDVGVTRLDGGSFPSAIDFVGLPSDGGAVRRVLTISDVTGRKAREARLLQAQKMEAVGQLTGGICHDFNNLLTVIVGNLREVAQEELTPEVREMAEDALSAAVDGVNLTRRLLAVTRERPLSPRPVDLRRTIDDFARLVRRMLREGVTLEVEAANETVAAVLDRGTLESAILNLVLNAQHALEGPGTVRVVADRVTRVPEDGGARRPWARIRVIDHGVGMSEETRQRSVEPFFTTREGGGGSGLGLSMVYSFVQQSGGLMEVDSAPGEGTSVALLFPAVAEASPRTSIFGRPASKAARGGERILLVEDDDRVRRYAARALGRLGYAVTEAEDGARAQAILGQEPSFDLVLTDIRMPGGVSGLDLADWIGSQMPWLRVILMTGYSPDDRRAVAERVASLPIVRKPFSEDELAREVDSALDAGLLMGPSPADR